MSQHRRHIKLDNTYVHNSIRKHGWHNFKVEILIDNIPEEDLSNLEIYYIAFFNTMCPYGYNLTRGGEGTSGYKHTKKAREKMSKAAICRLANRDQFGCVYFSKSHNRYQAEGPSPNSKFIGYYFTKEKAEESLTHFLKTGERIDSDRIQRKMGTGTIQKTNNGKRYRARYMKNKKRMSKTFDTVEQCEEWLKLELKLLI
tara:strand:+ start:265 stop:864 length:600 start_codon:yes stop_codon:yes gene_type:complete